MKLVIVESPTKARTISRFLGNNFIVESSNGHIRDLPKGNLGIDIDETDDFEIKYVIPRKKSKHVTKLKKIFEKADDVYLATDEDREGEAIAWHIYEILKTHSQKKKIKDKTFFRIAFHEITKSAIKQAIKNPTEINMAMVNAQQTRRILDRLVGYKLSPFLWKKITKGLSAGRVQSPTVRLIVERETEIAKFIPTEYWSIEALLQGTTNDKTEFLANLIKKDDVRIAKLDIKTTKQADEIKQDLIKAEYKVLDIKDKDKNKYTTPPFKTSTLQQRANQELGFSVKKTMFVAQKLYEGIPLEGKQAAGLITYLRTDSLNLSEDFLKQTKEYILNKYGSEYSKLTRYKTNKKTAQEAHEAIRPTDCTNTPDKIKQYLDNNQYKLYDLIWRKAVASQMTEARINTATIKIQALKKQTKYELKTSGSSIKFAGWLKLYPDKMKQIILPNIKIDETLKLLKINNKQHFTEPLPRYTEASLIKTLEKYGIGRPSTYSPIISTIQLRNYVTREDKRFRPTEIGELVNNFLIKHFPDIVNYEFTAKMEEDLDKIANNEINYMKMIKDFYKPFKKNLDKKEEEVAKKSFDEKTDKKCPKCGELLIIKMGRFGKFIACAGFPKCKFTENLKGKDNKSKENNGTGIKCPKCQKNEIVKKKTRKGRFFFGCPSWPKCDFALWNEPIDKKCEKCGSLLTKNGKKIKCSNKECDFILS
ncbi:type I DNA topoisomerase [Patescibacteria group bacterium]|nr:type I DNA topoisomerase [Patescibacteria group bacterium]